jgi:enoyl-CoA hydratase/carnithine racemase
MLERVERERVCYLYLAAPASLVGGSERLASDLLEACRRIQESAEPRTAVALISTSPAFMVAPPGSAAELDSLSRLWAEAVGAVGRLGPPTIAVIGGDAIGPAWELALACDLRLAAEQARLGSPEVRWGRLPGAGGTQRLTRLVGSSLALRLLLLGEVVAAPTALELGLVHGLAPASTLEAELERLLADLRAGAPIALAYAKESVQRSGDLSLAEGLRLEADLAALLQTTHDRPEGIAAFLERRVPRFDGR